MPPGRSRSPVREEPNMQTAKAAALCMVVSSGYRARVRMPFDVGPKEEDTTLPSIVEDSSTQKVGVSLLLCVKCFLLPKVGLCFAYFEPVCILVVFVHMHLQKMF